MKKVVVFGAAGHSGKYITRKMQSMPDAELTVFIRNPAKFEGMDMTGVTILQGDALNAEDVKKAMEGQDVLLCSLEGSPRPNSNFCLLSKEFARGAESVGHHVESLLISHKKIGGCLGCNACYRNGGACVQKDDMEEVRAKMLAALRGFTCCVPDAKEGGYVLGVGAMKAGDIKQTDAIEKAYQMGCKV